MTEYIHNPRRSPRLPIHCTIRLGLRSGSFVASSTIDIGPGGCGLETPWKVAVGERAFVDLRDARVLGAHLLSGHVAWSSPAPPWRCGIAFDSGSARAATSLFEQVARAYPDLPNGELVERIPADALLTPTPVPGSLTAIAPAEAEVLRALGDGTEAGALRDELGERWRACVNPLFALIERHAVLVGSKTTPDRGGTPQR